MNKVLLENMNWKNKNLNDWSEKLKRKWWKVCYEFRKNIVCCKLQAFHVINLTSNLYKPAWQSGSVKNAENVFWVCDRPRWGVQRGELTREGGRRVAELSCGIDCLGAAAHMSVQTKHLLDSHSNLLHMRSKSHIWATGYKLHTHLTNPLSI